MKSWVCIQRKRYRSGKLPQDKIDRLEGIGFEWDTCKLLEGKSLDVDEGLQKGCTVCLPS